MPERGRLPVAYHGRTGKECALAVENTGLWGKRKEEMLGKKRKAGKVKEYWKDGGKWNFLEERWNYKLVGGRLRVISGGRVIRHEASGDLCRLDVTQQPPVDSIWWEAYFNYHGVDYPPPDDLRSYGLKVMEFEIIRHLHTLDNPNLSDTQRERATAALASLFTMNHASPTKKEMLRRYERHEDYWSKYYPKEKKKWPRIHHTAMMRESCVWEALADMGKPQKKGMRLGKDWVKWAPMQGGKAERAIIAPRFLSARRRMMWFKSRVYSLMGFRAEGDMASPYSIEDPSEVGDGASAVITVSVPKLSPGDRITITVTKEDLRHACEFLGAPYPAELGDINNSGGGSEVGNPRLNSAVRGRHRAYENLRKHLWDADEDTKTRQKPARIIMKNGKYTD